MKPILRFLGLSKTDVVIYNELRLRPLTVESLPNILGKDRSTIYKSLKKLMDMGLVKRDVRILRSGGYKYIFRSKNKRISL